jgi:3-deoxy-D-manno-octulosonic-acid transferase
MVPYLLNLVYLAAILLASPWLAYQAVRKGKYREGFAAKFCGLVPQRRSDRPCVWLHAVSVGEVNLLPGPLAEIACRWPDWECVVSTTTMTGFALAKKKFPTLTVFYCPLDFTWAVQNAMQRIRPSLLILAELELWPNLIRAARQNGAKVAIINGRLSDRSFRGYARLRPFVSHVLRGIDLVAAQNQECADRFLALGASQECVHVTGSIKFDGAKTDRRNPATLQLRKLAAIDDKDLVFLAGSTQEPEESLALDTYRELSREYPQMRLIVVPRHPDRFESVARLLADSGLRWQRRTCLDSEGVDPTARVLLVDAVGELGAWWGAAHIAFVGGSLGKRGGQNMIEPAAYGASVSFGPNTQNFRDIVAALLTADAAVVVRDGTELTAFVRQMLTDRWLAAALGQRAQQLVASQLGATSRTLDLIATLMAPSTQKKIATAA